MVIMKKTQIFNKVRLSKPRRNQFDLSHDRKFTAQMGLLYPSLCQEAYPNESWSIDSESLIRTAPLVAPIMHQVDIIKDYFYIPNRILWKNWDLFITGGDKFNPQHVKPIAPYIVIPEGGFDVGSIPDYLGFPTGMGAGTRVSALPFAAYYRVYQEYYADENLMDTELWMLLDGDNTAKFLFLGLDKPPKKRCWDHDYFTSALPEPQKGPEVTIPLGEMAPLAYDKDADVGTIIRDSGGDPALTLDFESDGQGVLMNGAGDKRHVDVTGNTYVDLSAATSATVNSWRLAMSVQRLYERLARGGSRTIEFLRAVWDSRATSYQLDRPDYIRGTKEPLSISEVLQTSETDNSPQGTMAGHGVAVAKMRNGFYNTVDYGIFLGLFSVMPKTAYSQGVPKSWLRLTDRFDYYFPDLAHIGEQPVLNAELYLTSDEDHNKGTFGYLPYGTELRYINDSIHGEFRSSQSFWTLGREFAEPPELSEDFVTANPSRRVFADLSPTTDTLYCHMYHKIIAKRSIPLFGTPS